MKPSEFVYRRPTDVAGVLSLLQEHGDGAKVIAGGQSLVPAMNLRMATPSVLVDLGGIDSLAVMDITDDGSLMAGAMATHSSFLRDERVASGWPAIRLAVGHVAHEQVRNRGSIGGSLSHADPAAEWPAVCLLLDAEMTIAGHDGDRRIPAAEFTLGVYETALEPDELLTHVRFPAPLPNWRWGFHEIARRQGDFAMTGAIVGLAVDENKLITEGKLVVFAAEDRPRRLDSALSPITGQRLDRFDAELAGLSAAAAIEPRSDLHASADLRSHLVHVCVVRALTQAAGMVESGVQDE